MRKEITTIALAIGVLGSICLGIYNMQSKPKIAYVRSQELVYGFNGMKEMQTKFEEEKLLWNKEIEQLKGAYQQTLANYQAIANQLSEDEKRVQMAILESQYNNVMSKSQSLAEKAKEQEDNLLQGVLNQVNSFSESYGIEEGYDIILGTTLSGSILYGVEAMDITEDVLAALNEQYQNGLN